VFVCVEIRTVNVSYYSTKAPEYYTTVSYYTTNAAEYYTESPKYYSAPSYTTAAFKYHVAPTCYTTAASTYMVHGRRVQDGHYVVKRYFLNILNHKFSLQWFAFCQDSLPFKKSMLDSWFSFAEICVSLCNFTDENFHKKFSSHISLYGIDFEELNE
jgi:hypothetical protein